jgi:hypothetical protein
MPRRVESFVTGCRSDVRQRTHFSLRRWRPTLVVCTVTRFSLHHLGVSRARLWAAMFKKKKVIESLAHPDGAHTYTHTSHHITSHQAHTTRVYTSCTDERHHHRFSVFASLPHKPSRLWPRLARRGHPLVGVVASLWSQCGVAVQLASASVDFVGGWV